MIQYIFPTIYGDLGDGYATFTNTFTTSDFDKICSKCEVPPGHHICGRCWGIRLCNQWISGLA